SNFHPDKLRFRGHYPNLNHGSPPFPIQRRRFTLTTPISARSASNPVRVVTEFEPSTVLVRDLATMMAESCVTFGCGLFFKFQIDGDEDGTFEVFGSARNVIKGGAESLLSFVGNNFLPLGNASFSFLVSPILRGCAALVHAGLVDLRGMAVGWSTSVHVIRLCGGGQLDIIIPIPQVKGQTSGGLNVLYCAQVFNVRLGTLLTMLGALISGVTFGLVNPSTGCLAARYNLTKVSTFSIFIISGLTLRSKEIGAAAEAWPVGIVGLASILILTPVFSRIILQLNIQPSEFVTGLAIFNCMPTTLSSGVALTNLAGGNSALALAMTVTSNLLGILVVPFSISKYVAGGVGISVPAKALFKSLVLTLLIPLILGKFDGLDNLDKT
ncbi:hypothetical protein Dimus_021335, partial [Dionaea muscipula]